MIHWSAPAVLAFAFLGVLVLQWQREREWEKARRHLEDLVWAKTAPELAVAGKELKPELKLSPREAEERAALAAKLARSTGNPSKFRSLAGRPVGETGTA